jgi:hypothetical protein
MIAIIQAVKENDVAYQAAKNEVVRRSDGDRTSRIAGKGSRELTGHSHTDHNTHLVHQCRC